MYKESKIYLFFLSKDSPLKGLRFYNYTGKLADNFEYPYTIELVYNIYSSVSLGDMTQYQYDTTYKAFSPQKVNGKFTFIDASTCEAVFDEIHIAEKRWVGRICNDNYPERNEWTYTSFKKQ